MKDICNELDVRSLCHKILQNVSMLLRADRGSLFLVQGARGADRTCTSGTTSSGSGSDSQSQPQQPQQQQQQQPQGQNQGQGEMGSSPRPRMLVSKLFDVCSRSTLEEMEKKDEIRISWGTGIVGYVAESGEPVNIPDAYKVRHDTTRRATCSWALDTASSKYPILSFPHQ